MDIGVPIETGTVAGAPAIIASYNGDMPDVVAALFERGADLNAQDNDGKTMLHYAAAEGDSAVADALIEVGVDATANDIDGNTALFYAYTQAISRRRIETLKIVVDSAI